MSLQSLARFAPSCRGVALRSLLLAGCGSLLGTAFAQGEPACLDTLYASNNQGSDGGAVYFDVTVKNDLINVSSLSTNLDEPVGTPFELTVYVIEGTSQGNEATGVWTQVASGSGFAQGFDQPSPVDISDFRLTRGSWGIALVLNQAAGHHYTNGTGNCIDMVHFSDDVLDVRLGSASNIPFSHTPQEPVICSRVWNGTICYEALPACFQTISFDDQVEPCNYIETTALRERYADRGVHFDGPGPLDGAGIINMCGSNETSGHSAPNFIAMNPNGSFSDGGVPRGPETIRFDFPVRSVQISAGHSFSGVITMEAFDALGFSLGADSITGTAALAPLKVAAEGIRSVRIDFTGAACVLDDLIWDLGPGYAYCTAKVNSCGTTPAIAGTGVPSASASLGFVITGSNARANKFGMLLYTDGGANSLPFQGGTLCVNGPVRRTTTVSSGGTAGCDGEFRIDMNAFASGSLGGNTRAFLNSPGQTVHVQWWGRDSVSQGSYLSDGWTYCVGD